MPKEHKTPQEKKRLELEKDHFTFSEDPHGFRKIWRRKKAQANRGRRRKIQQLISKVRPGISSKETDSIAGDVTPARLGLIARKPLRKSGTVTLGEKIKFKLNKREETTGRRADRRSKYDALVTTAVETLARLEGDQLVDVIKRIALLSQGGDPVEWMRLYRSSEPLDRAVFFVEQVIRGDGFYIDALRRNEELCQEFQLWKKKANRILAKLRRPNELKREQKITAEKKMKALRRKQIPEE